VRVAQAGIAAQAGEAAGIRSQIGNSGFDDAARTPHPALFSSTFCAYIVFAGASRLWR
jgi:hypothetical protein